MMLVVQGECINLGDGVPNMPSLQEMMIRVAEDPVGQVVAFELMMRLFLQHVLGVRPECLGGRHGKARLRTREWCTDGVAASSTAPGIFGPVLAFRGEIEAQGRGSLHPHILVWLVEQGWHDMLRDVLRDKTTLRARVQAWVDRTIEAVHSVQVNTYTEVRTSYPEADIPDLPFTEDMRDASGYTGELDGAGQLRAPQLEVRPKPPDGNITAANQHENEYERPLTGAALSTLPTYRRWTCVLVDPETDEAQVLGDDATVYAKYVADDGYKLYIRSHLHDCGPSCWKYSGSELCRHGFWCPGSAATAGRAARDPEWAACERSAQRPGHARWCGCRGTKSR